MTRPSPRRALPDSVTWNGTWHDLALRFPKHPEDEVREMAASIKHLGLLNDCVMDSEGTGLDGIGRVAACALAGVEPTWKVFDGDPVAFIVAVNAARRHLSTGQKAMAVAIGLDRDGGRSRTGRFRRGSIPAMPDNPGSGVKAWTNAVTQARFVLDHSRELADQVLAGDVALDAAYRRAVEAIRAKERLANLDPELAALVTSGSIGMDEAFRRHERQQGIEELRKRYPDLADKVEASELSIKDAEEVADESDERRGAWTTDIVHAIQVFQEMAGSPIPREIKERLDEDQYKALARILKVLEQIGIS